MPLEAELLERMALYRRAEEPVRAFFATHFGGLCSLCGSIAAATGQHVCCCIGVPCVQHLQESPVLRAMAEANPQNRTLVEERAAKHEWSLLGPAGCLLDWGRPPPCNVCVCTAQRTCLCAVMSSSQAAAFNRSLRAYYAIADPALRSMATVRTAVAQLVAQTGKANELVRSSPHRFAQAMARETNRLLDFCDQMGVARPPV
jgi:hypothetical protein